MHVTMKDRVAIVTGGSKGIGFAVARRFAESGARVAIVARGEKDLAAARTALAKDGLDVRDYVCDVSKAVEVSTTYREDRPRFRQGRRARQQCRHLARDVVRNRHR